MLYWTGSMKIEVIYKRYIIKVSQLNSSFCVLLKRYRGKILGDRQKKLFDDLKAITEDIHMPSNLRYLKGNIFPILNL